MEVISITSNSRNLAFLSWPEASEAASKEGSTLVWPFGACEQHGPHLPLITDTLFAESILKEVFDCLPNDLPIWSLPSQSIGFSPEHLSFPGTLSLSGDLMLKMISEVGKQLSEMGFQRLVFFNAHGGQIGLLQAIARELRVQCPSMAVLPCFLWSGIDSLKDLIPHKEVEQGLHAALAETSLMLSLNSDLVGEARPFDGDMDVFDKKRILPPEGWSLEGAAPCAWLTQDLSKTGVVGDSRGSTPELGNQLRKKLVEHWIKLFLNLLDSNWPPIDHQK
ncbi:MULTISPECIES: creatininase family protein [Prochlorococcus]|uniref:Creatinine amidohydrolase related enzyme n=1 Tax=Prochlorococcus marinus (strain SARG / CCMP1375 / SS120) TaxID=167539 RepID=Q7VD52_PROMA|nr:MULTISPECIES: creatininase family protein [Prochlorococcus]AAP99576.1 Creatinine amidohydrolase related enzyme [Prochlorococcus marinus subsp. marinus str. CCMP1375]KGG11152.1 Creatinine amidohydrolase related enzyme [Prochlorococcus marinus str. LG]KGG21490.1 Creatinine amidohydrolase related enzyme [Prochlorococcus marinus str. SS2]KGG23165.1 Creatinine amidohydrolase related enzyme [Prochlorococcus marinus str. SS35]KGG33876.1 Creatinine amidohydrolase related enzyme [Prochlorococcus mar